MNKKELNYIKENYFSDPSEAVGLNLIYEMIEEAFEVEVVSENRRLLRERMEGTTLTLESIPDISVSELGWTDVRTVGDQEVSGPARNQLLQFTKNIQGSDLQAKLTSLAEFYNNPDSINLEGITAGQRIASALSYLVFYKTLTKVISNFNAASAGFNFEAFLAVLLEGAQIQANTGTIADFKTGDNTPISLKLYAEKSVVVGGSFNDLVGDLVEPKFSPHDFMQYVVVMKSFEGESQGLGVQGDLKFFRFNFTLDNVADLVLESMDKSVVCIQISSEFIQRVSAGETDYDFGATLPAQENLSPEVLESKFIEKFSELVNQPIVYTRSRSKPEINVNLTPEEIESFNTNQLDWSKQDELFKPVELGDQFRVHRGKSPILVSNSTLDAAVTNAFAERGYDKLQMWAIKAAVARATAEVNEEYSAATLKSQRADMLRAPEAFADPQTSVEFYNSLTDPELKKRALLNTKGRLSNLQFDLNRGHVIRISENIGQIKIGAVYVQEVLNKVVKDLREGLFDIFQLVAVIKDGTYAFMAGGLQDDSQAEKAIAASNQIEGKVQEIRPADNAEVDL
tara:strand:- start:23 stop:1729 length:1707 start_codon:yes stop_codon:yes gene_type:complete